jgi:hypothetical protein
VALDASRLYARNVLTLVEHLWDGESLVIDPEDEITGPTLLGHDSEIRNARVAAELAAEREGGASS